MIFIVANIDAAHAMNKGVTSCFPGWDSPELTAKAHNFFELGGIVLFFVVVVFELLAYFYGHRHEFKLLKKPLASQA